MFGGKRSNEVLAAMVRVPGKYRRRVPFKKPLSLFQVIRQGKNKEDQAGCLGKYRTKQKKRKHRRTSQDGAPRAKPVVPP
jgi:hypothetical protein